MRVYNTMSQRKEELVPLKPGVISMYVCGPTVYNFIHIGNARPLVVFDTLRRYLEYCGFKVNYVQNFTDIDDKLINRANEEKTTVPAIAEKYIGEYYTDADGLNVERSTVSPRATEHIDEIIALVEKLVELGHAYPADNGDVYFSVRSFPGYGKLSGQSIDDLEENASERRFSGEMKRDPLDFTLWKGAKPGEPAWDSPWGKGRPGWHIECSAMSMNILGDSFDIHAGGYDLIFPHHENEIAQSEAATGKPFARYWMHNQYLNINGIKMSKSLKNFLLVRGVTEIYDPEVLRFFLLSAHYRSLLNYTVEGMDQSLAAYNRLKTARERMADAQTAPEKTAGEDEFVAALDTFKSRFTDAMDDDLNTADAIGVLFDFARAANTFVTEPRSRESVDKAAALFDELTAILGLFLKKGEEFPREALDLLDARIAARKAKNWAEADRIRDELKAMGFVVEDSKSGAKLKRV